ncbi:type II toxin-antitoxin system Phd/YefM family antitoxin [Candidatus Fermentibacteria bacterium]|nr:type II toxin-antitoxin system Phd/YefM family antitoxin [Candidatus Fermentibacteria bacterium]
MAMAVTVSKSRFKARALEYLRDVERTGNEVIITDRGNPVAVVAPYRVDVNKALAGVRGSVIRYDRPTEPAIPPEEWEALS